MANKPWLKKSDNKEINIDGATIKIKTLSFGDSRKAMSQAIEVDPFTKKSKVDATFLGVLRALYQIEDWDLTDENDKKLPITLETFDNVLDEDFVGKIMQEINKAQPQGVTEVEKKELRSATLKSLEGKKVENPPSSLLEYELCKSFHCLPSELAKEDNKKIEEFIVIMQAINEHDKKGDKKKKRDDLKSKFGASARR